VPSNEDLAAPERWLESQRRSRSRRFAAARTAARRRFGRRSTYLVTAALALGAGGAAAQTGGSTTTASQTASSSTVQQIQTQLGVTADGVIGPITRRALRAYQRNNGLTVDGVIGPQVLESMGIDATTTTATTTSAPSSALAAIAQCESGGDPTAVSSTGQYRGKYQFSRTTWRRMGGTGDPAAAPEATQDQLAAKLYALEGASPWPVCGR
jgi:peptidoglycan hydrolase-like protein with peptidoglycan-binding domain